MGKREQAREEAAFMRGDVGIDGVATDEDQRDEAEVEKGKAREQFLRGKTYLGREFLTWLLWKSESGDPLYERDGAPVTVLMGGKIVLRGVAGEVVEMIARGTMAPYSEQVRTALSNGLLVHTARLRITHGERIFEATLDAEFLDVRSAKLPDLMRDEEDDRLAERLWLVEQLSGHVQSLAEEFLRVRSSKRWSKEIVPAMKKWMR